jgi:hypothetical protein
LSLGFENGALPSAVYTHTGQRTPHLVLPTEAEREAHRAFLAKLEEPLWLLP